MGYTKKELETALISGDGTENNPFIIDYDKAPNFEKSVSSSGDILVNDLAKSNHDVNTYCIFDDVLTVNRRRLPMADINDIILNKCR